MSNKSTTYPRGALNFILVILVVLHRSRPKVRAALPHRPRAPRPPKLAARLRACAAPVHCAAPARLAAQRGRACVLLVDLPPGGVRCAPCAWHDDGLPAAEQLRVALLRLVVPPRDVLVPCGHRCVLRDHEPQVRREALERHDHVLRDERQVPHETQADALRFCAARWFVEYTSMDVSEGTRLRTSRRRSSAAPPRSGASVVRPGTARWPARDPVRRRHSPSESGGSGRTRSCAGSCSKGTQKTGPVRRKVEACGQRGD
ncbi:hypothetical protein B0H10DRAFT_865421 [Mycena sp. CBHHK59/15]|nr:hypothetical protein B0H10DRAFT_865421 [Mycena sp. CBHHK59/15]